MTHEELLDLMNADAARLLADCTLTLRQNLPASDLDPVTRKRLVSAESLTVAGVRAIRDQDLTDRSDERRLVRRRVWLVPAASLTFAPTTACEVIDHDSAEPWRVVDHLLQQAGREWRITGERTG